MSLINWLRVLSFIVVFSLMKYYKSNENERILESFLNEEYSGVVSAKWVEHKNHGARKLKINEHDVVLPGITMELFNSIKIGDSLSKEKNSLEGYLFTNDSIFIIDYKRSIPGVW